jgi:hypothetical protein
LLLEVGSSDCIGFFSSGYDHGYLTTVVKKWSDFSKYWSSDSTKMNMQQMLECLLAGQQQMMARTADNLREMREEIRSGQAEIKSAIEEGVKAAIQSIPSERDETIQQRVENVMMRITHETQSLQKACLETTAAQEATEADTEKTEPDPGMMQSVGEHQEVPKEDAAVMPVRGLRKRRRDRNLATGRCQKPKGRIRESCESRRRSTIAGRKMTRCATVAWRKGNVVRKIRTEENCGPRKRLTVAGRKTTRCATEAWCSENVVRKDWTGNQAKRGTPKR